ncbi:MAG: hypothetical protein AB7F35_13820 [Acetobacteraceae bacterium]
MSSLVGAMKRRGQKLLMWSLWTSLGIIWGGIAIIAYWLCYTPVLFSDMEGRAYAAHSRHVQPGEVMRVSRPFCLARDVTAIIRQELRDGVIYHLPELSVDFLKGCHAHLVELQIPSVVPPGQYRYRITVEYRINPIRVLAVQFPDLDLVIDSPAADALQP